jgi:hypothetical protein
VVRVAPLARRVRAREVKLGQRLRVRPGGEANKEEEARRDDVSVNVSVEFQILAPFDWSKNAFG